MAHRAPATGGPLDYLPTPPWAGRALTQALEEHGFGPFALSTCWEPACGEGHLAAPLREAFGHVWASDVHPFRSWPATCDAPWPGGVRPFWCDARHGAPAAIARKVDWVVTNPPFSLARRFVDVGRRTAGQGVAIVCRTGWVDGVGRFERLFERDPPTLILQFAERVPMHKGRWRPNGSTASHYAAFVWDRLAPPAGRTEFAWIRPGAKATFMSPADLARWAPTT